MTATLPSTAPIQDFSLGYLTLHELPIFPVCRAIDEKHCEHEVWHKGGRCTSPGKVPLVPWKEYQTRLPTEVEVRSWWRKWPTANIGMATGEVSGVCVVDLDGELAQREAQRLGYDDGPWVATGRIGGKHLYFRWRSDAPSIFAKQSGIDFRGQGGFVLLPPSYHASGNAYKWGQAPQQGTPLPGLPLWVNDLAGDRSDASSSEWKPPLSVAELLAEGVPENERDETFFRVAAKLRGADVPFDVALELVERIAAACTPPPREGRAKEKVRNAYERYEPNPPEPSPLVVPSVEQSTEPFSLDVLTAREVSALPTPGTDAELLGPVVIKGARVALGAHTGHGKTTMTLQMISAIVNGKSFLGWQGKGGVRALVLDAEQGLRSLQRRIAEAGIELSENICFIRQPDGLALDKDNRHREALEHVLAEGDYAVVVADPLYKLHTGDANAERESVDLMKLFDRWRESYGFALLMPMHCRKPPIGSKFTMHEFFGSSAYLRGAEVVLGLQLVRDGYSRLFFFKDRDGDLPINEQWGLLFDRENGYTRDPDDGDRKPTTTDLLREAMLQTPGMTVVQLARAAKVSDKTVRKTLKAMDDVVCDSTGQSHKELWYVVEGGE